MPQILDREEGHQRRKDRLAKQKKGPGAFVYTGESVDTHWSPTPKLTGTRAPALAADGMPVVDAAGRQIYKPAGQIVTDERGIPVLGGVPKVERTPVESRIVRGVSFPKGKPVAVDAALALKLRCMAHFEEVEAVQIETEPSPVSAEAEEEPAKRRGRPKKSDSSEG